MSYTSKEVTWFLIYWKWDYKWKSGTSIRAN